MWLREREGQSDFTRRDEVEDSVPQPGCGIHRGFRRKSQRAKLRMSERKMTIALKVKYLCLPFVIVRVI